MLLKEKDSEEQDIKELESLLKYELSEKQRFFIEREISAIKKGVKGEKDCAYYINFYYQNSKNWVVIHDLRLEFNGRTAQIDHLLINRVFDIYVIESKNYKYGIRITKDYEFEAWYNNHYIGIPSPAEQNRRHIELLKEIINYYDILPKRLSIKIKPAFYNYILISPHSILKKPNIKEETFFRILKADAIDTVIQENADNISNLKAISHVSKFVSLSTIEKFGKDLIALHKPSKTDWKKKFGINTNHKTENSEKKHYFCSMCKKEISEKEAYFCWSHKDIFKGKAFCYQCQKKIRG